MNLELRNEYDVKLANNTVTLVQSVETNVQSALKEYADKKTDLELIRANPQKAWTYGNSLSMVVEFTFKADEEKVKEGRKLIAAYLKRARLALRVHGGSSDKPLVHASSDNAQRRYYRHVNRDDSVFRSVGISASSASYYGYPHITDKQALDLITEKKLDLDSMYSLFGPTMSGDQKWDNIKNRFRNYWGPRLLFVLTKGKLEVPNT